jgi:prevent-host-death family protein
MKTINLREAKATLSAIIESAEAGEPVTITRHGKAAAVVVPVDVAKRLYPSRKSFGDFLLSFPSLPESIECKPSRRRKIDR